MEQLDQQKDVLTIKQFIHQEIPYKKEIIFFGSRANGIHTKDSDYDFLVIVHEGNVNRKTLVRSQAKIKRLCARAGLDADVIVRDNAHVEEVRDFPGNIIYSAFQAGTRI
ncbi:MAG: nucleotidyltransferase domain-containing protein [bacterium]|nr:nucleotidyltransferase domain-containing protein [bacterium]